MVVGRVHPGVEQPVEVGQGRRDGPGPAVAGDLRQELAADGAEEPFDLSPALRPGREWTSRMPSTAQPRSSQESTNADPLSVL